MFRTAPVVPGLFYLNEFYNFKCRKTGVMNKATKAFLYYFVLFFAVFQLLWWSIYFLFPGLKGIYIAVISGALTAILTPQFKKAETQNGQKIEVKWLFLKKPFFIT